MAISFNVEPYFDDFESIASGNTLSPKEQYQRILFRPGKAVQARELTQLQTQLQNQVSSHGDHTFKDGSVVVPGAVHLHNKIDYIKLDSVNSYADTVAELVGTEFTDGTNVARVIHASLASGADPITLFVKYISGTVFADNATITDGANKSAEVKAASATGFGSIVALEDGIYYIKKHFVTAKAKTIVLSKYTHNVSFDIGLLVTESLVSSGTDSSLNDNATGTPNESAPGAHRYSITATLSSQAVNATTGNFVLIARLEDGFITKNARTADYNHLADELARRTFDESGNYYVNPFKALVKDHASVATKLTLGVEPSKAYVRGYEIQTLGTTPVHFDRARTSELVTDKVTEITHNNFIEIDNMDGFPDITTFGLIDIENAAGASVGTCRARSIERVSGNGGTTASRYRLHIFDFTGTMTAATQLDARSGFDFAANIAQTDSVNIFNLGPDGLIFELPYKRIKTLNSQTDGSTDYNFRFETNRIHSATGNVTSGVAIFTTGVANEVFGSKSLNTNWILVNDGGSGLTDNPPVSVGNIVFSNANQTATISGLGAYDGDALRLIAPMVRTADMKTKTLSGNTAVNFSAGVSYAGDGQQLGHADVHELISVVEDSGSANVTEHFDLDTGQKDTHYDAGRIKLKSTSNYTASVALTVTYKYFDHSAGDFFTVDSYSAIDYADIPKVGDLELRSCVDFRPRTGNAGAVFTGTGAVTAFCPTRFSQFETDIQFYLPRIDKVFLDAKGNFGVAGGVPARYPEAPEIPSDSMHLYTMTIPAYTLTADEVTLEFIDNRRYTMRDIGRIDKRISQIEYYSVLSFLEAEAQNKQILDSSNDSRWKSGFLVDAFSNTRMSNSSSVEYRAAVDIKNRILRPSFASGNASLTHDGTSTTVKTGDLVTLPYTTNSTASNLISQTQYSGQINVNPYDVFNWTGAMALTPSTDEWRDIDRRPEVVINNDGEFDAMKAALQPQVGTVWNSWSTNWTGQKSWQRSGNWNIQTEKGNSRRTGIQQTIQVQTSRFSAGDRIVEVNFIPFMRTRLVSFVATRLKPATQVFAFFDGVSVANFVSTTASTYTPLVGINSVTAHPAGATTLTTDANGSVSGSFLIPNNSALNFKTGEKEFKLTQSSANNDEVTETSATAMYNASGLLESRENVIISTRTPVIQRLSVEETRVDNRETARRRVNWCDPLAQSILLDQAAFVTSVDLYFTAKDAGIPVNVSIREMVNGFPTQKIIPFSDVTLNPGSVSTSGATAFTFPSPVYLQDGVEYAIVIMSNSNKYLVRYAEIGKEDQTGARISQQPYAGVLFKSQNASTWTADQNKDLTFVLKRAVFTKDTNYNAVLLNEELPSRALITNPLTTVVSTASAANIFTVAHRDHGMVATDTVTFTGFAATNGYDFSTATTTAGSFVIGTQYKIVAVGNTTQAQWETAGVPAGTTAAANVVFTAAAAGTGTGTAYAHELNKIHTITAVTQDAYTITVAGGGHIAAITAGIGGGTTCQATQNLSWNTIHPVIQNIILPNTSQSWTIRDTAVGAATTLGASSTALAVIANDNYTPLTPKVIKRGTTSTVRLDGTFHTTNDYLSPVIDMERCSIITIGNRIDNVTSGETNASTGANLAKYVTKTIELNDSSDGIKVYLDVNRPNGTFVDLYYKTGNTAATFDAGSWVLGVPSTNNGVVAYSDGTEYEETQWEIGIPTAIAAFTIFAIKIVMRSDSTSKIPMCQDLRAIALRK
jgi:hypothetical protein|tara:strand:+ start:1677 stop:6845 length:5169 start_codon:yes stop_codon:yes gene_type:complete